MSNMTKASISLACKFLATVLRILSRTFARHSCECRENFLVLRTSHKLVAKFFNMLKNFMRIFSPKYFARLSHDSRATVVRRSCECGKLVAAKFWRIYNAKFSRHSYECRTTVTRQSCENLATIWRENKTKRHSYECRATLARMSHDCCTNLNENKLHSRESRETLSRMSRDSCEGRATVARYIFKIRPKFANLSQKCLFNETATRKLCLYRLPLSQNSRELFAN